MQIEQVSALERRVKVSVPMGEVATEVDARLKRLARTVKMPGFRPGKVPMKLVVQNYGYQVQNDVMTERINAAVRGALEAAQLRVAGAPRVEPVEGQAEDAEHAEFYAVFETYPEIVFGDWQQAEVERAVAPVTDAEVDKTIDILRKQRQTFEATDRASQAGDRVTVDFVGRIDGVEFDGGKAEDFAFELGSKQMLAEFDAAAMGLKSGETKVFPLTFPEDYHGKDVAGKTAEFTITVKSVAAPKLPPLDADFAKQLGIEDGDIAKLREDVKANLQREVKGRLKSKTKESVMNALLKVAAFEVPKSLVAADIERLREMAQQDLKQRGIKTDGMPFPADLFQAQAERRVRLGLVIAEIIKQNELKAAQEQVKTYIEEFSQSYEDPSAVMAWYLADRQRLAEVEAAVLEDNVVEWVLGKTRVSDAAIAFDELMGTPY